MRELKHLHTNSNFSVHYNILRNGTTLEISFIVKKTIPSPWNFSEKFSRTDHSLNWDLWNFDVVEFFLQGRSYEDDYQKKYFEFQISPLEQKLELEIEKPRENWKHLDQDILQVNSQLSPHEWRVRAQLDLNVIGLGNRKIYGGVFVCLGPKEQREYHSSVEKLLAPLDFHQPLYFKAMT